MKKAYISRKIIENGDRNTAQYKSNKWNDVKKCDHFFELFGPKHFGGNQIG